MSDRILTPAEVADLAERNRLNAQDTDVQALVATVQAAWAERVVYQAGIQVLAQDYAEVCAEVVRLTALVERHREDSRA